MINLQIYPCKRSISKKSPVRRKNEAPAPKEKGWAMGGENIPRQRRKNFVPKNKKSVGEGSKKCWDVRDGTSL